MAASASVARMRVTNIGTTTTTTATTTTTTTNTTTTATTVRLGGVGGSGTSLKPAFTEHGEVQGDDALPESEGVEGHVTARAAGEVVEEAGETVADGVVRR